MRRQPFLEAPFHGWETARPLGRFALPGFFVIFLLFLSLPIFAQEITRISQPGISATEPRMASASDGDCAVVWQQSTAALPAPVVAIRQRRLGVWGPVQVVGSGTPGGSVREPLIRLDSSEHPHVVWVSGNDRENSLQYSFLAESVWVRYGQIAPPTSHKIEHPVLMMGPHKQMFLVWQESVGLVYQIHAFVIDTKGNATHRILAGQDQMRYVIYPDLMEIPPALPGQEPRIAVVWFSLEKTEGALEMRIWDPLKGDWTTEKAPAWTAQSLQSLPLVAGSPAGAPILIGYRPEGRYDRIFLSSEKFPLAYLDGKTAVQNRLPRIGQPLNNTFGLVWQQETDEGINLVQGALRPTGSIFSAPLAQVDSLLPPQPDVALSTQTLMTVWTALVREPTLQNPISTTAFQIPAIYFSELKISDSAWRPLAVATAGEK